MTFHANNTSLVTFGRALQIVILLAFLTLTSGCVSMPTRTTDTVNIADACSIANKRHDWYQSMEKTEKKWGIPVHVQMAIIHQESKFQADAQPPRKKLFGFFPGPRPSTAYGFAQALDGTWAHYIEQTKNYGADRDDFDDATDFIGWYTDISKRKLNISKGDARSQYLAYHEGHGGYKRQTYRGKKWLVRVAKKVETNANRFRNQLGRCKAKPRGFFSWKS